MDELDKAVEVLRRHLHEIYVSVAVHSLGVQNHSHIIFVR